MPAPLILLAGTSESGKSTAGAYLADRGAYRVKIRSLLADLTTGTPVTHEGVPMREGFDHQEFVELVHRLAQPDDSRVLVIESFIDADLAAATRRAWTGAARITFITATRTNRIARLAATQQVTLHDAASIVDGKDDRKRVVAQWARWRAIADDWIDNDGDHAAYLASLDLILTTLRTAANHEGTT